MSRRTLGVRGYNRDLVGKKLLLLRDRQGITQAELAGMVGCSPMKISLLERGQQPMTLDLALMLCSSLGTSIDELISDEPSMQLSLTA